MRKSKTIAIAVSLLLVFLFARLVYGLLLSERNGADAPTVPVESAEAEEAAAPDTIAAPPTDKAVRRVKRKRITHRKRSQHGRALG